MRNAEYENTVFGPQLNSRVNHGYRFAVGISIFAARVNAIPSLEEEEGKGRDLTTVQQGPCFTFVLFRDIGLLIRPASGS